MHPSYRPFVGCLGLMIALLLGAGSKKAQVEETPPIQLLLIQAQSLSRLELASTRIKVTLRIDPHRDGFLGFKKLFGSKVTRVELQSQASVFCDLALLTEGMITQRADSTIDLRLPPLEIRRELDDLHHTVIQEPTGLRRRLSTNELDEFIASKQADIDKHIEEALQRHRPELIRTAYSTLEKKLQPIFQDLRLTVHLHLDPADEALLSPASPTSIPLQAS